MLHPRTFLLLCLLLSSTLGCGQAHIVSYFNPIQGKVRDKITVYGSGFNGVTALTMNDRVCSFRVVSNTEIETWIPNGDSGGLIRVWKGTLAATSGSRITINPLPQANIYAYGLDQVNQASPSGKKHPNVLGMFSGGDHNIFLKGINTLELWGSQTTAMIPSHISSFVTGQHVKDIALGSDFTILLRGDGKIAAWGENGSGQATIPGEITSAVAVAAGSYHGMALTTAGDIYCWGSDNRGQAPQGKIDFADVFIQIAGGDQYSVALTSNGEAYGWGDTSFGQLGSSSGTVSTPTKLSSFNSAGPYMQLAAGRYHLIGLTREGSLVGMGRGDEGQLNFPEIQEQIISIAAGNTQSMALTESGRVYIWGQTFQNDQTSGNPPFPLPDQACIISSGVNHFNILQDASIPAEWEFDQNLGAFFATRTGWNWKEELGFYAPHIPWIYSSSFNKWLVVLNIDSGWWDTVYIGSTRWWYYTTDWDALSPLPAFIPHAIKLSGDLNFGRIFVGNSSKKTFTITNIGNLQTTITSVQYPEGFTGDWSGGILSAKESKDIEVSFNPTVEKTYTSEITLTSSDNPTPYSISVYGSANNFIYVSGGSFIPIGQTQSVQVDDFEISAFEVNYGEWDKVAWWGGDNGYEIYLSRQHVCEDFPLSGKTWHEVLRWCNAKSEMEGLEPVYYQSDSVYKTATEGTITRNLSANGYRLPTKNEWEYAARGVQAEEQYAYSGSNDIDSIAWYSGNHVGGTCTRTYEDIGNSVGQKNPNGLGIYDMSGNVWEFIWYGTSGYYSSSGVNYATIAGGSWQSQDLNELKVNSLFSIPLDQTGFTFGFRYVLNH